MELPDVEDFCVICIFDRVDKVLRLAFRSLFWQLTFLLVDSVVARGLPPLSEHNLRHFQLQKAEVEAEWRSPILGVRNNQSRFSSTFNVDLTKLSKIITYSESNTEVVGWTDEIHHHCYRWIIGVEMHVLHLLSSFLLSGNRDILFRSGCFCTRYNSVTCFASSYNFPFGSSGYSSKLQVFSDPEPMCMTYPGSNFPSLAEVSRFTSSRFLRRNRTFVHHSHCENSMRTGFWVKICLSSPWLCRIHSSISSTISFVLAPGSMWNMNWIFSPSTILADFLYCSR